MLRSKNVAQMTPISLLDKKNGISDKIYVKIILYDPFFNFVLNFLLSDQSLLK